MASGSRQNLGSYYDTAANKAIEAYSAPNPLKPSIDAHTQAILDWENSTAPKDVRNAPGIDTFLNTYDTANDLANQEQMGNGAMRLSDSNSGYADQLKQLNSFNRFNTKASNMETAWQNLHNEANGSAQQSISQTDAHNANAANMALTNQNNYYNRPHPLGFGGGPLASQGLGVAGQIGLGLATGGASMAANSAQKLSGQKLSDNRLSILQ